jgi:hypothetical protein
MTEKADQVPGPEDRPMWRPRLRFSVRTLMIAVAIVAVAPVAAVKVQTLLDLRWRCLDEAETCARERSVHREKVASHDRDLAAWLAQLGQGLPPDPKNPWMTDAWRRQRVEYDRKQLALERANVESLESRERAYRRAAGRPWDADAVEAAGIRP